MKKRYSQKREDIHNTLRNHDGALSAAAIHTALPYVDLTTIYRNLEQFVTEQMVKKINIKGESLYEYQPHPHHHAICDKCNRVIHFTAPDEKIKQLLGLSNFEIHNLEMIVHGTCHHKIT